MDGEVALFAAFALPVLGLRVLLLVERQVLRRRWLRTDEHVTPVALRGHKAAHVVLADDGRSASFTGVGRGGSYGREDEARCRERPCAVPGLDCACGFYALKDRAAASALVEGRPRALLEVELHGRVLSYERGYRAQRQRVLGVAFEPWCADCRTAGVERRALALTPANGLAHAARRQSAGRAGGALQPACSEHARDRAQAVTPAELAGLLGTEVGWTTLA